MAAQDEKLKKVLDKVWVNVYSSSSLSDEQVRRLASRHNTENVGSKQTRWMERVTACRQWLYHVARKDYTQDDTPPSTTEWKRACHNMYMANDKVYLNLL